MFGALAGQYIGVLEGTLDVQYDLNYRDALFAPKSVPIWVKFPSQAIRTLSPLRFPR